MDGGIHKEDIVAGLSNSIFLKRTLDADADFYSESNDGDVAYFKGLYGQASEMARGVLKAAFESGFCADCDVKELAGRVSDTYGLEMLTQSYEKNLSDEQVETLYSMLSLNHDLRTLDFPSGKEQRAWASA